MIGFWNWSPHQGWVLTPPGLGANPTRVGCITPPGLGAILSVKEPFRVHLRRKSGAAAFSRRTDIPGTLHVSRRRKQPRRICPAERADDTRLI